MNATELKKKWLAEEEIAHIKGWDFSHIEGKFHSEEDHMPWDYKTVIQKYLKPTDKILDMDTGGGEFLLSLGHPYHLTSATEGYAPNVTLCRETFTPLGIDFREMEDESQMPFDDATFDIVLNRHGSYDPKEIYRVLKPGGLFITQQVGEDNDWELVKLVLPDHEKSFPGHNVTMQAKLFTNVGFTALEQDEVHKPIRFFDTSALVWFARVIPWEFTNFSVESSFENLLEVEKQIRAKGFVEGKVHRFYFVMRK